MDNKNVIYTFRFKTSKQNVLAYFIQNIPQATVNLCIRRIGIIVIDT